MKPALLVIDMLEDYFSDGYLVEVRSSLTKSINSLIRLARDFAFPIIWVRQEFEADLSDAFLVMRKKNIKKTIRATHGASILSELDRQSGDHEVIKKRYSAFFGTDLDSHLGQLKIDTLIIAGINTHACVRMAAIDAYQRDYEVLIVRDCVASADHDHHRISLDYLDGEISQVIDLAKLGSICATSSTPAIK
jgi:nicotinamidase-related amidase